MTNTPQHPQGQNPHGQPGNRAEILLCVTGGVACFKAASLTSMLVKNGFGVNVAMTEAAQKFVTPLTFQSLSGRAVHTDMWHSPDRWDPHHISLTDAADLVIVAPATANTLAKCAAGIADDLVSTLLCASLGSKDILIAPAMNTRMWENPITQRNIHMLKSFGVAFSGPTTGRMACGTFGPGRMAEANEIFEAVSKILTGGDKIV